MALLLARSGRKPSVLRTDKYFVNARICKLLVGKGTEMMVCKNSDVVYRI